MKQPPRKMWLAESTRIAVRDIVLAAGFTGLYMAEIVQAAGRSKSCVGMCLRASRELGELEKSSNSGACTRWGPPGIGAALRHGLLLDLGPLELQRRDRMLANRRERMRRVRNGKKRGGDDGSLAPLRRTVTAATAEPLEKTGPASVWEWAA